MSQVALHPFGIIVVCNGRRVWLNCDCLSVVFCLESIWLVYLLVNFVGVSMEMV
eukprot:m.171759 g.171759  ORF g.171759 m.171759 type:complete len:54 (+) comp31661_c0_seq5:1006-1167(+)